MYNQLYEFLKRNYTNDVDELNELLNLKGNAKLANEVPPNPFVGNPELLSPGNCIAMFGINPAYRPNMKGFYETEIELPNDCLERWKRKNEVKHLEPWLDKIKNYFVSDAYYGRYFTRLGNILGQEKFRETWLESGKFSGARTTFHKHVLKLDIIPYYSAKANFNEKLLKNAYENHPALIHYKDFISNLLSSTMPKWIFLNGNAPTRMIESLFSRQKFERKNIGPTKRTEISVGRISLGGRLIPVLGVKFVNSINGPTSDQDWEYIWPLWNEWLSENI
ncbi:MAG: hypothetical protein CMB56_006880 [Methanobacteriota archaeon]|nr:MAG: hypothetical protein CMB56_006880 [Euryarchaeota archaeon]|tara:strand:+ start:1866 stop:2699 length:834 start_codon:yes stop_codon:yes gene_type:complete